MQFKCMVATHTKKILHNLLCVTGVHLREVINTFFSGFFFFFYLKFKLNVSHLSITTILVLCILKDYIV